MCLSACPHQCLGTRRAGDRHAELPGRARTRYLCASLHKQLLQPRPATQPHKTLCTCWMGFPQAQEPANWELSKVPAIFWEKNQPEQRGTRRHAVGSEGIAHQGQGLHSLHLGRGHALAHWQEHKG